MNKKNTEIMHNAFAMALHNLLVRNNINHQDFINTMRDTRINKLYIQNPPSETK